MLYKFLTKKYFFDPSNRESFLEDLKNKPFVPDQTHTSVPKEVWNLVDCGYKKNPKERPSILEYIKHPAFDGIRDKYKFLVELSQSVEPLNNKDKLQKSIKLIKIFFKNLNLYMEGHEAVSGGNSQELRFFFVKKSLQYLSYVTLYFNQKKVPPIFQGFLDQETLDKVRKSEKFQKVMEDLKSSIEQQKRIFKEDFTAICKKYEKEAETNKILRENLQLMQDLNMKIDTNTLQHYLSRALITFQEEDTQEKLNKLFSWEQKEDETHLFE